MLLEIFLRLTESSLFFSLLIRKYLLFSAAIIILVCLFHSRSSVTFIPSSLAEDSCETTVCPIFIFMGWTFFRLMKRKVVFVAFATRPFDVMNFNTNNASALSTMLGLLNWFCFLGILFMEICVLTIWIQIWKIYKKSSNVIKVGEHFLIKISKLIKF